MYGWPGIRQDLHSLSLKTIEMQKMLAKSWMEQQSVGQDAGWNCPLVKCGPSHGCVVVVVEPPEADARSTQMTSAMSAVTEDTTLTTAPKVEDHGAVGDHGAEAGQHHAVTHEAEAGADMKADLHQQDRGHVHHLRANCGDNCTTFSLPAAWTATLVPQALRAYMCMHRFGALYIFNSCWGLLYNLV